MANKKSIQILRTKVDATTTASEEALVKGSGNANKQILAGQPIFDTANNWLYVGVNDGTISGQKSMFGGNVTEEFQTIHPNYAERCLSDSEVADIWSDAWNTATATPPTTPTTPTT